MAPTLYWSSLILSLLYGSFLATRQPKNMSFIKKIVKLNSNLIFQFHGIFILAFFVVIL